MSRDIAPFPVRIPPELRERLEASRTAAGRSLNAEIVQRLTESFASDPSRTMGEKEIKVLARELRALMREEEERR